MMIALTVFSEVGEGSEYQFDIVLKRKLDTKTLMVCQEGMGDGDRCHAVVHDVPWENKREINWEKTNCYKKNQNSEQGKQLFR